MSGDVLSDLLRAVRLRGAGGRGPFPSWGRSSHLERARPPGQARGSRHLLRTAPASIAILDKHRRPGRHHGSATDPDVRC